VALSVLIATNVYFAKRLIKSLDDIAREVQSLSTDVAVLFSHLGLRRPRR